MEPAVNNKKGRSTLASWPCKQLRPGFGGGGMLDEYSYGGSLGGEKPRHDDLARMEAFVDVDEA